MKKALSKNSFKPIKTRRYKIQADILVWINNGQPHFVYICSYIFVNDSEFLILFLSLVNYIYKRRWIGYVLCRQWITQQDLQ